MRRLPCIAVLVAALLFTIPAQAATINVPCSGPTALVNAVATANSQPGADVLSLASRCTYTFTAPDNNWFGPNALPAIASAVVIDGNGAVVERSSAGGTPPFRLFFVGADPADPDTDDYVSPGAGSLTLRDVTLRNGYAKGGNGAGGGAGMGGAIFNMGELALLRVTAYDNTARGGTGSTAVIGGGGMGEDGSATAGGGFGGSVPTGVGAAGGAGDLVEGTGGAGGGAGFRVDEAGLAGSQGGNGGGPQTGLGGGSHDATGGDGSGGGGDALNGQAAGGGGGAFGRGGMAGTPVGFGAGAGGGGGGVGGGGAPGTSNAFGFAGNGGGGGFGAGGGSGSVISGGGHAYEGGGGFGGGRAGIAGSGLGGAIFNFQGELSIDRSTLTQNRAVSPTNDGESVGEGGALFNLNGPVSISDSTFGFNVAGREIAGVVQNGSTNPGGSIYNFGADAATPRDATVTLHRSVVGRSVPQTFEVYSYQPNEFTADVSVYLADHNVIFNPGSGGHGLLINGSSTSQFVEPQLGQFGTYRNGLTPVVPLKSNSVARDMAGTECAATDQIGQERPAGAECDAGAVEYRAPANDNFADAQAITGMPSSLGGDTLGATSEVGLDGQPDVWYRWTAPSTAAASAQVCPVTGATVVVYTGPSADNLTQIATANGANCGAATAAFGAVSGTTYSIRVITGGEPFTLNATGPGTADTTAPDTTIDSGPSGPGQEAQPTFAFHASEPSSFECSLDQGTPVFVACTGDYTPAVPLADGAYTFRVRAKDAANNVDASPATRSFTVDHAPPTATIDSGPSGSTNQARPTFGFHLSEDGTLECSIDQGTPSFVPCNGGTFQPASDLADGDWTFRVKGTDAAGNAGTATTRAFTVDTRVPDPVPPGGSPDSTPPPGGETTPPPVTPSGSTALAVKPGCTKRLTIRALRKAGRCTTTATASRAGVLKITWRQGKTVIASGKVTVRAAGPVKLTLRLTKPGRKLLGKARKVTVTATAVLGPDTARRKFTLK